MPHINLAARRRIRRRAEEFCIFARLASLLRMRRTPRLHYSAHLPAPAPAPVAALSHPVPEVLPVLLRRPQRHRAHDRAHRLHEDVLEREGGVTAAVSIGTIPSSVR